METEKTRLSARGGTQPGTYVSVRQEIKATSQGVDGYGQPLTREWTIVYDVRDGPMTGDTLKRAGRIVITGMQEISPDGKVMTVTTNGVNAAGQTIRHVAVFEKQG